MGANDAPKLYELDLRRINVTVKGISPLITNRFSEENQEQIENKQQGGASKGKPPRDPKAEFLGAQYRTESGAYGLPAASFKEAMVRAAKPTDMAMTDARAFFQVPGDLLPLRCSEPIMRTDRVVLNGRTTSVAYRPMFEEWEVDVPVVYNAMAISAEQIINLLELAGFGTGVGAWRPECKGSFGMFEVKRDE